MHALCDLYLYKVMITRVGHGHKFTAQKLPDLTSVMVHTLHRCNGQSIVAMT